MNKLDITTIILTYNEEIHIQRCLENVCQFSKRVIVVDSPSTDRTQEIIKSLSPIPFPLGEGDHSGMTEDGCRIDLVVHKYPGNQAEQFNWALDNIKIDTEWILRIDADEYLTPELINEMHEKLPTLPAEVSAVVLPLGRAFMGRVLKHGIVNGIKMIRLFRYGKVRYELRLMDEHLKVLEGETVTFDNKFIDDNRMSIKAFVDKHNNYSSREAALLLEAEYSLNDNSLTPAPLQRRGETIRGRDGSEGDLLAEEVAAKRAQKEKYAKMPLFWRSLAYFVYRYIVKLGFLDGKEGFLWDFFQGFWYRMLVDAKVYECKKACGNDKEKIREYIRTRWGIEV